MATNKKVEKAKKTCTTPSKMVSRQNEADQAATVVATMDRRAGQDRRKTSERRQRNEPVAVDRRVIERRAKVSRRRQIDPTTCERDYTTDEVEFMNALEGYKRRSGRMFPTCSEVLEVLRALGYEKRPPPPTAEPSPHLIEFALPGGQVHQVAGD